MRLVYNPKTSFHDSRSLPGCIGLHRCTKQKRFSGFDFNKMDNAVEVSHDINFTIYASDVSV